MHHIGRQRTDVVATVGQLRALRRVCKTIKRMFEVRILDKGTRVIRVGLGNRTGAIARARSVAVAALAARAFVGVVLGHSNTDADTNGNDNYKGNDGTNHLRKPGEIKYEKRRHAKQKQATHDEFRPACPSSFLLLQVASSTVATVHVTVSPVVVVERHVGRLIRRVITTAGTGRQVRS